VRRLQEELNDLPEALARSLVLRGVETLAQARHYFRASVSTLHDPFDLPEMDLAVDRLQEAMRNDERVVVYGDYDVDGTTGTAMMTDFLRRAGLTVDYFVPNRLRHGYGLSAIGLEEALENGAGLVISVDCGITAVEEAEWLAGRGVDLIISDHHEPKEALPRAIAVLDPKRADSRYPYSELSGCAVAFKLLQALRMKDPGLPDPVDDYLDLVAVSTASDIVPLTGENRVLMREGLDALRTRPRTGLAALSKHARIDLSQITTRQIVFAMGPRINAAGRLGDAGRAVELLRTRDRVVADSLALQLERQNHERRELDRVTVEEALQTAFDRIKEYPYGLVIFGPDWHPGVIGIVASRVVETFYRPAVLLTRVNGSVKGSARSIPGINIFQVLQKCSDLLHDFGGHEFAAGLSLPEENVEALATRVNDAVSAAAVPEMLHPTLRIDAVLDLDQIDTRFWAVLKQFEPHGPGNRAPVFLSKAVRIATEPRLVGRDNRHLKFGVRQSDGSPVLDVIAFGMSDRLDTVLKARHTGTTIDLAHSVSEKTWNGRTTRQLKARDLRLDGE
jgi:single-stranded-DNA-specific exonuclease